MSYNFAEDLANSTLPEEARLVLSAIVASSDFLESAKDSFEEYDKDKNGHIDHHELKTALEAMYSQIEQDCHADRITTELVDQTFKQFDSNQDEQLDFNEYVEFCKCMTLKLFADE